LADPAVAAAYLNETRKNSPEHFLSALKNVAQARKMALVAKDAGVQRETLYRSLSEQGNPTYDTLISVLAAVGITFDFMPIKRETHVVNNSPTPVQMKSGSPQKHAASGMKREEEVSNDISMAPVFVSPVGQAYAEMGAANG